MFIQGAAATPTRLVTALAAHGKTADLRNVQTCAMHTEGKAEYADPSMEKHFRSVSFFMGGNVRKAVADGRADTIPIFLHEIPQLFHKKIFRPDVALISVSIAVFYYSVSFCIEINEKCNNFVGFSTRRARLLLLGNQR